MRLTKSPTVASLNFFPQKQCAQPGWFAVVESQLLPLTEKRNQAMKALLARRTRLSTEKLREARRLVKDAVAHAKDVWISKHCTEINTAIARGAGTKRCWDAVSALRKGMSKCGFQLSEQ